MHMLGYLDANVHLTVSTENVPDIWQSQIPFLTQRGFTITRHWALFLWTQCPPQNCMIGLTAHMCSRPCMGVVLADWELGVSDDLMAWIKQAPAPNSTKSSEIHPKKR